MIKRFNEFESLNEGFISNLKQKITHLIDAGIKFKFTQQEWKELLKIDKQGKNIPASVKVKLQNFVDQNSEARQFYGFRITMAAVCLLLIWKFWWGGFHADITLEDGTVIKHALVTKSLKKNACIESNGKIYELDEVQLSNYGW